MVLKGTGKSVKKYFWLISTLFVFMSGFVMQISYRTSGAAAWSYFVSSINDSPWEQIKPFVLACIMWSFVKLSVLRPPLLHFVSCEILSFHIFIILACAVLSVSRLASNECLFEPAVILPALLLSQSISQKMVSGAVRTELFFIPIMISFGLLITIILFASFFPPNFYPFLIH